MRGHHLANALIGSCTGFKSCPREGASFATCEVYISLQVSSRAPVRGHPVMTIKIFGISRGFKSCPREGASDSTTDCSGCPYVSSRAPVRGHPGQKQFQYPYWCFKSCPREGASIVIFARPDVVYVSSRAPVRGHPPMMGLSGRMIMFQVVPP